MKTWIGLLLLPAACTAPPAPSGPASLSVVPPGFYSPARPARLPQSTKPTAGVPRPQVQPDPVDDEGRRRLNQLDDRLDSLQQKLNRENP